jgi:uncharacterized protein
MTPELLSQEAHSTASPRLQLRDFFYVILLGFGIGACFAFVLGLIIGIADVSVDDSSVWFVFGIVALIYLGIGMAVHILVVERRGIGWKELGLRPPDRGFILMTLGVWVLTMIATSVVSLVITSLVDDPPDVADQLGVAESLSFSGLDVGILLLATVVAPAVVEEVVFRTLLYSPLRSRWSFVPAAVVTSVVFAAVHGAVLVMPVLFVLGLSLAWLRERFDSLYPPIVLHALNNGLAMALFLGST